MPEEGQGKKRVCLMGPPRVLSGTDGQEMPLGKAETELLALLVVCTLLLPPDGVWQEFRDSQGAAGYEVKRDWLVAALCPEDYAQAGHRQGARDRVGYLLDRLHPRGAAHLPLPFRLFPAGDSRERGVARVTWRHLDLDLAALLAAARQPHGPAGQEKVMALAGRPLLEGTAYPWLQRPEFRRARARLDAAYLTALCGRADSLLVLMENARADGRAEDGYAARTKVLPLLDRAAERLHGEAGSLDRPELADLRPFPKTVEDLRARAAYPAPQGAAPPASPLPQSVTKFFGREREMAEIQGLLASGRMVTLTGMGGCGKTRLALEVAALQAEGRGDVRLVEIASLTDPEAVAGRVAERLGLKEQPGVSPTAALIAHLGDKRMLLLLDNCEHLLDACASLVRELLRSCAGLKVLATSRVPMDVDGEQLCLVPPLPFPTPDCLPADAPDPVGALLRYDSARLFLDRALQFRRFTLAPENVGPVAAICATLEGIPLALELAAARVKALPVAQIAEMLSDRFGLLTDGRRDSPSRHKTLRALIDWSYDLLSEAEQGLLCRLSVFAGGWTLDAAEAVGASGSINGGGILGLLTGLVDKSLIMAQTESVPGRYRTLETVRQYAQDRLRERGEWEETRRAHRAFYLQLAEEAAPQLRGPDQKRWLDRLETEIDNLRAALLSCEDKPQRDEEEAEMVQRTETYLHISGLLLPLWQMRGHLSEGRKWLDGALRQWKGLELNGHINAPATPKGEALWAAGVLAYHQSDYNVAQALAEESLVIRRQLGNPEDIAACLNSLGNVAMQRGDGVAATALFRESLSIRRQTGNQQGIASTLNNLGIVIRNQGNHGEATTLFEESLTIRRQLGNPEDIATSLKSLASVATFQGNYTDAVVLLEESLTIFRLLQDQHGIAYTLRDLGSIALMQRDFGLAQTLFEECLLILRRLGDLLRVSMVYCSLGSVALQQGDCRLARAHYKEGLTVLRQIGSPLGIAYGLEGYSAVTHTENQLTQTAKLIGAAQAHRLAIGIPLPPVEQQEAVIQVAEVQEAMGVETFATALAEGRAMTWEQAVAFALEKDAP